MAVRPLDHVTPLNEIRIQQQLNGFLHDRRAPADQLIPATHRVEDVTETLNKLTSEEIFSCGTGRYGSGHGLCSTRCITEHNR